MQPLLTPLETETRNDRQLSDERSGAWKAIVALVVLIAGFMVALVLLTGGGDETIDETPGEAPPVEQVDEVS